MSLLERMRSGTDSTAMQVVFALVVISFVFWGVLPQGEIKMVVAQVNGTELLIEDYRPISRQFRASFIRSNGDELPTEEEEARIADQAKQYMVQREVLYQEASALGFEVDGSEIYASMIREPAFQKDTDRDGEPDTFDDALWREALNAQNLSVADWEDKERKRLMVEKLYWMVVSAARVSDHRIREDYIQSNSSIEIEYVSFDDIDLRNRIDPSQAEVTAWIADHAEAVQKRYDRDKPARYDLPERLRLRQIELKLLEHGPKSAELRERLEDIRSDLLKGGDFDDLARTWSEHESARRGGEMGLVGTARLDPKVSEAVAGLEAGAVTPVVDLEGAVAIYQLEERLAARTIPLGEVQRTIGRALLVEERAPQLAKELSDGLLEAWQAEGEAPIGYLVQHQLELEKTGQVPLNWEPGLSDPPREMVDAALGAQGRPVLPQVYGTAGLRFVGQLVHRQDADMARYEAQHERLRETAMLRARASLWSDYVDRAVSRAKVTIPASLSS